MKSKQRYGLLTAVTFVGRDKHRGAFWLFKCDCGKEKVILANNVRRGLSVSCGCYQKKTMSVRNTTHGLSHKIPEYKSWTEMRARCLNPDSSAYPNYGGRGIKVCKRWDKFKNFLEDMGPRPSLLHSLDRWPDNDGDYKPSNCRWATDKEQNRNKRNNFIVNYKGQEMCLAEAADQCGIDSRTLWKRIVMRGWEVNRALEEPKHG